MASSKLYVILILLISSINVYACRLSQDIVSLSGPITMTLDHLGLAQDKRLLAISTFHKLSKPFSGEVLAGGIFLAKRTLKKYKDSVIFYDRSKELSREFKKIQVSMSREVYTLEKNPFETVKYTLKLLSPLTLNCDNEFKKLIKEIDLAEQELSIPTGNYYFFLGRIGFKLPNLLIANDMFILSLRQIKGFSTYNSQLNYVPWSKKLLEGSTDNYKIGVYESSSEKISLTYDDQGNGNISSRGLLIPGIRQVQLLSFFKSKEFRNYVSRSQKK